MATYTQGIYIDGTLYDVPLVSMDVTYDVLDKYAERDEETGDLKREILGVYANYTMEFGIVDDDNLYKSLRNKLTEPVEFHNFSLPDVGEMFEFRGYISKVKASTLKIYTETTKFKGLGCSFTMKAPYRTP